MIKWLNFTYFSFFKKLPIGPTQIEQILTLMPQFKKKIDQNFF